MSLRLSVTMLLALGSFKSSAVGQQGLIGPRIYRGMCDASAAVALDEQTFVVANDEDNLLRIYKTEGSGAPIATFDLVSVLKLDPDDGEMDIEGAARIGDRIYWITSHARDSDAEKRPNRPYFFATRITGIAAQPLELDGAPYVKLVKDQRAEKSLDEFNLGKAARRAPKDKGGLDIEGLAATPNGELIIGFRNPIRQGRALLVPIRNPGALIKGKSIDFGRPITLDLQGSGIRSIEYWPLERAYLIIAGPYDAEGKFHLYRWTGNPDDDPRRVEDVRFGSLNPEALFVAPRANGAPLVHILSDDGTRDIDGSHCKDLEPDQQRFRAVIWSRQ